MLTGILGNRVKELGLDIVEIWHEYMGAGRLSEFGSKSSKENKRLREICLKSQQGMVLVNIPVASGYLKVTSHINYDKILRRPNLLKRVYHTFF